MSWLKRISCNHRWAEKKLSQGSKPITIVFIDKRGRWRKWCIICGKTEKVGNGIVEFPRDEVIL